MHKKQNQRTVGIQSTDFYSEEYESPSRPARVTKKPGFRNLLQQSVTIVSQENHEENENLHLPQEHHSKGVQTGNESPETFQRFRSGGRSLELPLSTKQSLGREDESRTPTSELMKITEGRAGTSNPGTSRVMSGTLGSISVISQINEIYIQRNEGSVAVVYSNTKKDSRNSISSNYPQFYGSQGSRRFSDETVLLIEDYQSYDHRNAAGRQEPIGYTRRAPILCCKRNSRRSAEVLTRPLPLHMEEGFEEDEEEVVCRICHEGEEVEPLIQPCLCKGSVGCVHANCLKIWLEQSNTSRCELCNYPYAIRQTKKYSKWVSVRVFYKTIIDRRAMAYDVTSFVIITPLTLVGVVMCIQASLYSPGSSSGESNFHMGYITKVGMIMLSGTIVIAYAVWLYTLVSYHFKAWRKWYTSSYDVEVIPVRMTSEERLEAARRLSEEMRNRRVPSEQTTTIVTVIQSPPHSYYQTRVSVPAATLLPQRNR